MAGINYVSGSRCVIIDCDLQDPPEFIYDLNNDKFEIEALNSETKLKPLLIIEKLSIVGNFDKPLDAWSTESESNVMNNIGAGRFECFIKLKKDFWNELVAYKLTLYFFSQILTIAHLK